MNKKTALPQRLRESRIFAGMSQIEAAQALQIANTTLSQYETGKRMPGIQILKRMSTLYNVPLEQYIEFESHTKEIALSNEEVLRLCLLKTRLPELIECLCEAETKMNDEKLKLTYHVLTALLK